MDKENRRHPRFDCAGTASVRIAAGVPLCPAKILNLSVAGCLMELQRPEDLPVGTIVELIFDVNHLPFRVRGQVKAIRSGRKIGFEFPPMRERAQRDLRDLIEELKENASTHSAGLAPHVYSVIGSRVDPNHWSQAGSASDKPLSPKQKPAHTPNGPVPAKHPKKPHLL